MLDDATPQMTLRDYTAIVVRRRVTVLVVLVVCLAAAAAVVGSTDRLYRASARAVVRSTSSSAVFGSSNPSVTEARRRISNEIAVIEGVEVRQRVRDALGLATLPPRAEGSSSAVDDIVSVAVVSSDPDLAAATANAYIDAYNAMKREQVVAGLARAVEELQGQITRLQVDIDDIDTSLAVDGISDQDRDRYESSRRELVAQQAVFQRTLDQRQVDSNLVDDPAQLVEPALAPTAPFQPTPLRTGLLGLFAGLVLGIAAALARDRFDQSIKEPSDIVKVGTVLPLLARVPPSTVDGSKAIAVLRGNEAGLENYRSLRTNMQFVAVDRDVKVVQVTSAIPGEGKTTTASNLAIVMAQTDAKVLLLDADLRKPMVHEAFGLAASTGLVDVLIGAPLDAVLQRVTDHLDVLPAGRVPVNPSEMLSSRRMGEVIGELRDRYDFIVVDSAPVLPVSDAAALSRHVDAVLTVVQVGRATVPQVRQAIATLDQVQAPLIGLVLNRVRSAREANYGYGYGYGRPGEAEKKSHG